MVVQQLNGFTGFGRDNDEAIRACKISSVMSSIRNISMYPEFMARRAELAPWAPRENTLQVSGIGYFTYRDKCVHLGNTSISVQSGLYELLYKLLFDRMSLVDISIITLELENFFTANHVFFKLFSDYPLISLGPVNVTSSGVTHDVTVGDYEILLYDENKVSLKMLGEEFWWTCNYDEDFYVEDILYYIAYFAGYKNFTEVFKE